MNTAHVLPLALCILVAFCAAVLMIAGVA